MLTTPLKSARKAATFRTRLARRLRDDRGSATIESVMWLPIFIAFFALVADTAMVFNNRSLALKLLQDANRAYAIGRLTTDAETQTYIYDRIKGLSPTAKVTTKVSTSNVITSSLQMPAADLDAVGLFSKIAKMTVTVSATHMKEP